MRYFLLICAILTQATLLGQSNDSIAHSLGLLKLDFDESEIDSMRSIKGVFDPDGILNPGKIFTT